MWASLFLWLMVTSHSPRQPPLNVRVESSISSATGTDRKRSRVVGKITRECAGPAWVRGAPCLDVRPGARVGANRAAGCNYPRHGPSGTRWSSRVRAFAPGSSSTAQLADHLHDVGGREPK